MDCFAQFIERGVISARRQGRFQRAEAGGARCTPLRVRQKPVRHVFSCYRFGCIEQSQPDKRPIGSRAGICMRGQLWLQRQSGFVSDITRQFAARLFTITAPGSIRRHEDIGHIVCCVGHKNLARIDVGNRLRMRLRHAHRPAKQMAWECRPDPWATPY
jgi:hypothetical protein